MVVLVAAQVLDLLHLMVVLVFQDKDTMEELQVDQLLIMEEVEAEDLQRRVATVLVLLEVMVVQGQQTQLQDLQ